MQYIELHTVKASKFTRLNDHKLLYIHRENKGYIL